MTVVLKVGGSLLDFAELKPRLTRILAEYPQAVLVVGGGPAADAVRLYDRVHAIGEERSHWLAMRAMTLNAHVLGELLGLPVVAQPTRGQQILDAARFFQMHDDLPHRWDVTSDSLSARAACILGAEKLIVLKSTSSASWQDAVAAGVLDAYFPQALGCDLPVQIINLRA